jgi:MYXO-CTERM domain-containing protein
MKSLALFLLICCLCRSGWAANICDETVPSNRIIDGIPAYQQCTGSTSSAIYSNDGVDTATASAGSDWVRTQASGGYQCTELAHRYLTFKWGINKVPNGNAGAWCDGTLPSGLEKTTTPVHGDVIVFAPGSCGADATTGHVAVIDVVNTNATVTFIEQNRANRRSCAISTAACFLHVTANDGTVNDGGATDVPPAGGIDAVHPHSDAPAEGRQADVIASGGVTGTGGTVAAGTGGAVASGGATGGQPGTGGASASAGGSGGTTGSLATEPSSGDGCSCRTSAGRPARGSSLLWLALLVTLIARRRRHS